MTSYKELINTFIDEWEKVIFYVKDSTIDHTYTVNNIFDEKAVELLNEYKVFECLDYSTDQIIKKAKKNQFIKAEHADFMCDLGDKLESGDEIAKKAGYDDYMDMLTNMSINDRTLNNKIANIDISITFNNLKDRILKRFSQLSCVIFDKVNYQSAFINTIELLIKDAKSSIENNRIQKFYLDRLEGIKYYYPQFILSPSQYPLASKELNNLLGEDTIIKPSGSAIFKRFYNAFNMSFLIAQDLLNSKSIRLNQLSYSLVISFYFEYETIEKFEKLFDYNCENDYNDIKLHKLSDKRYTSNALNFIQKLSQ